MTQEEKDLLIKDLCYRLPYKVKVHAKYTDLGETIEVDGIVKMIDADGGFVGIEVMYDTSSSWTCVDIDNVKPYLFPLSSMSEEQRNEFDTRTFEIMFGEVVCKKNDEIGYGKLIAFDLYFYNKHHLDWRGLISKGLAIDATNKNIY